MTRAAQSHQARLIDRSKVPPCRTPNAQEGVWFRGALDFFPTARSVHQGFLDSGRCRLCRYCPAARSASEGETRPKLIGGFGRWAGLTSVLTPDTTPSRCGWGISGTPYLALTQRCRTASDRFVHRSGAVSDRTLAAAAGQATNSIMAIPASIRAACRRRGPKPRDIWSRTCTSGASR
jgi:hypothetical protein